MSGIERQMSMKACCYWISCTQYKYIPTHRCEAFNGLLREHNIHSDRKAPSRDIANSFASCTRSSSVSLQPEERSTEVILSCIIILLNSSHNTCSCGEGLQQLIEDAEVQSLLHGSCKEQWKIHIPTWSSKEGKGIDIDNQVQRVLKTYYWNQIKWLSWISVRLWTITRTHTQSGPHSEERIHFEKHCYWW